MIERTGDSSLCESVVSEAPDGPPRKSKKTRRGKKKKLRYEDDDSPLETTLQSPNVTDILLLGGVGDDNEDFVVGTSSNNSNNVAVSSSSSGTGTPYEIPEKTKVGREQNKNRANSSRSCLLRPTDVPKAPENSTQFIIDDHEDCNLYFSFERKNINNNDSSSGEDADGSASPAFAGFRDIDYEYESPDDLVTSAFYEQDFENIYRHAREDELLSKPRDVIMHQYLELEQRVLELEARVAPKLMVKVDPASMIAQLQEELLKLQEENCALRSEKRTLLRDDIVDELVNDDDNQNALDRIVEMSLEKEVDQESEAEDNDNSRTKCGETSSLMVIGEPVVTSSVED